MVHLWRDKLRRFFGRVPGTPASAAEERKTGDGLDDCNPRTNGEYFLLEEMARDWSLVLDVGANQGDYAAEVQKVNPACRVVCFEPNRDLLPALQGRRIAEIHTTAVGDTGDNITIHINTADPSQSSLFRRSSDTVERRVPCVMLDDFCVSRGVERIDMVKIDTEGNETAVLRGMRHLIERSVADMIQFEYGGTYRDAGTSLKEAFDLLSEQYIVCRLCPQGLVPCAYGAVQEHYRYSNWVAVSRRLHGR